MSDQAEDDLYLDLVDARAQFKGNRELAIEIYGALSNMRWRREAHKPDEAWSCSWRSAGHIAAELCGLGENYLDYYCSGNEGVVTDRVREMLAERGWQPLPWP
jgi:hypothetical protein